MAEAHKPVVVDFEEPHRFTAVFGERSARLARLRRAFDVEAHQRGTEITLTGAVPAVLAAAEALEQLHGEARRGMVLDDADFDRAVERLKADPESRLETLHAEDTTIRTGRKAIRPKTFGQRRYIDTIRRHDITIAAGPAGSGKTYLAVAVAVEMLARKQVRRIVLSRPAVEAGERLGFLPGTLLDKIHPYLRPLYDAVGDLTEPDKAARMMEDGTVEVAPLAFMRGRTLNDAFVILDEAQNATVEQMKMMITRLGFGSKMVVTGDDTQCDLVPASRSGLPSAMRVLSSVTGVGVMRLAAEDVVRHPLVTRIVTAWAAAESEAGAP